MELTPHQQELKQYLEMMVDLRKKMGNLGKLPDGFRYWGMEDYLLHNGTWYMPKPYPKRYRQGIPQHCFGNSAVFAITHRVPYIEGVSLGIIPCHHAWNADKEGNVIDSTWDDDIGKAYIGCSFKPREVNRLLAKGATMLDNWQDGHPLFKEM